MKKHKEVYLAVPPNRYGIPTGLHKVADLRQRYANDQAALRYIKEAVRIR